MNQTSNPRALIPPGYPVRTNNPYLEPWAYIAAATFRMLKRALGYEPKRQYVCLLKTRERSEQAFPERTA